MTASRIELVRTLDERHISSSIVFEAMHIAAVMVIDGAPFRLPDGSVDRERLTAAAQSALARVPEFGMRLMPSPLGVTTPAWVPDDRFDTRRHLYFDDSSEPLTGATLRRMVGFERGSLPMDRPLWDMTLTALPSGEIAVATRMHHVVGDGQWGFDILRRLTDDEPTTPDAWRAGGAPGIPPRTSLAIPVHALRAFVTAQPLTAAWREYWRKPFIKRVRRVVGRNTRPLSEWWIRRAGLRAKHLPPTRAAVIDIDAQSVANLSTSLGGSLSDLVVAAALGAADDDARGRDLLIPVSRRRRGEAGAARNHISITRVHAEPGASLAARVAAVRRIVRAAVVGKDVSDPEGRMLGYATLMSLSDEPRWFGDARVTRVVALPAGDPRSEMSVLGTVYDGAISIAIFSRAELDVDAMAVRMAAELTDAANATAHTPVDREVAA